MKILLLDLPRKSQQRTVRELGQANALTAENRSTSVEDCRRRGFDKITMGFLTRRRAQKFVSLVFFFKIYDMTVISKMAVFAVQDVLF